MIDSWLDCFKKIDKFKIQKTLFDSGVIYTQNSLFSHNNTQTIKKLSFDKYNIININKKINSENSNKLISASQKSGYTKYLSNINKKTKIQRAAVITQPLENFGFRVAKKVVEENTEKINKITKLKQINNNNN